MNKHKLFCRCNTCKQKRRSSAFYLSLILITAIIIFYQLIILLFITTKFNVFLLLLEFGLISFLIFFIFF
ncbi:MAG: hypothetical protein IK137_03555 [Bacilli bacterium]|nr:hypothetical protein [Bacilli bacterium]